MGAVGEDGPSTKSMTGCIIANTGDVTNVNVSRNINVIWWF